MKYILYVTALLLAVGFFIELTLLPFFWSVILVITAIYLSASYLNYLKAHRVVPLDFAEAYDTLVSVETKIEQETHRLSKEKSELKNAITQLKDEYEKKAVKYNNEIQKAVTFLNGKDSDLVMAQVSVDFSDEITSSEIKNELALVKLKEKELIKNKGVKFSNNNFKTKSERNKKMKQLIRTFNAETEYYISNVTAKNVDTYRNRIVRSFQQINNLFEIDNVKLTQDFLKLKLEILELTYNYQVKLENEREILRAQKEEIREQQRAEKEIQLAKRKLEKESRQFNNEIKKMMEYLSKANNDIERNIYADKITELQDRIDKLEKDKEDVLKREMNTRAGFVYIISNIGSFGDNIYKIGMTRRLEPMDRIKELSSASVPFTYDVHAIIFSEDAPKLENTLHNHFKGKEVNRVNPRKEFYNVNIEEIRDVIYIKYDKTANFVTEAEASQYRETLRLLNK